MPELHPEIQEIHQQAYRDAVDREKRMRNHDTSISVMIDHEDDERIGLSGRDPEQQVVRLAAAFNEMKAERNQLRAALEYYADKRNWKRTQYGLCEFRKDTNGPYIAVSALQDLF